MKLTKWMVAVALLASVVVGLTACGGGGSNGTSSTSEAKPAEEAGAGESVGTEEKSEAGSVVEAPPTSPPTENPVDIPLSKKPPTGKKVTFLQCELSACELFRPGLESATKALGWSLEPLVFNSAEPGKALQQAISEGPDFIVMSGVPTAVMKPQMAAAQKAGIPVISCSTVEKPEPGGYAAQCVGSEEREAEYIGRWMINDSEGNAHVAVLTLPLYPILGTETNYFEKKFEKECPGCSYELVELTPEELGAGSVPQKVVGFLQSNPEINYVFSTFNDPARGLPEILKSSGYGEKVKVVGAAADASIIQGIPDKYAAFTQAPHGWMSWAMIDAAARLSVGDEITEKYEEEIYTDPLWVIDTKEAAESLKSVGYEWPGPEGFEESFEKLWQLK